MSSRVPVQEMTPDVKLEEDTPGQPGNQRNGAWRFRKEAAFPNVQGAWGSPWPGASAAKGWRKVTSMGRSGSCLWPSGGEHSPPSETLFPGTLPSGGHGEHRSDRSELRDDTAAGHEWLGGRTRDKAQRHSGGKWQPPQGPAFLREHTWTGAGTAVSRWGRKGCGSGRGFSGGTGE